jgi:hypothetical protein
MSDEQLGPDEVLVYLSTDGKHTVVSKDLELARLAYDEIVEKYGTKAKMWEGVINKKQVPGQTKMAVGADSPDNPTCSVCGGPTTYKEGVARTGKPWKGYFCSNRSHPPKWAK